jgi:hypothetical protein
MIPQKLPFGGAEYHHIIGSQKRGSTTEQNPSNSADVDPQGTRPIQAMTSPPGHNGWLNKDPPPPKQAFGSAVWGVHPWAADKLGT